MGKVESYNILGYKVTANYPDFPIRGKIVINTINPHSYCVAKEDVFFQEALKNSDILLPDGIGIVWAAKVLKNERIQKIAGFDMFQYIMKELNKINGSCFFLGASEKTLDLIKRRAAKDFSNVRIETYSPPFKPIFTEEDSIMMYNKVNEVRPDVLFVGMTAPKQEKWSYQFKDKLDVKIICSIGAVFDFYAGTVKRAPRWMVKLGMEWIHRSILNPKKLGMRNLKSNPKFVIEVLKEKYLFK